MRTNRCYYLLVVFNLLLFLFVPLETTFARYSGGTGEPNDPYLIATPEDLNDIGNHTEDWGSHFLMTNDIDLAELEGESFNSIGTQSSNFTGVFNGGGYAVYNLTVVGSYGLFNYVGETGSEVKNLGLVDPNIRTVGTIYNIGGIAGSVLNYVTISNCYVEGGIVIGEYKVGSIVGYVGDSEISNCYSRDVTVIGTRYVGGLFGSAYGNITDCYSSSNATGSEYQVGGFVGRSGGNIERCYSTGAVSGGSETGGFTGYSSGRIYNCYWDVNTSGLNESAGRLGRTTEQMQDKNTYIGFGCSGNWKIDNGNDYPRLIWEAGTGELIERPEYSGGTGEPNEPFLISTPQDLLVLSYSRCDWDKHFVLANDINMAELDSEQLWEIGEYDEYSFSGVFDGNNHVIYNLVKEQSHGLFGYVSGSNALIKNLGLFNPDINSFSLDDVGCLVGRLYGGAEITNCYIKDGNIRGDDNVGALVGYSENNTLVSGCFTEDVNVTGCYYIGGLVGRIRKSTVMDCYSNCYVVGTIRSGGGLIGYVDIDCYVAYCYSAGTVDVLEHAGGLVATGGTGDVYFSYWDVNTSGLDYSSGGEGKTTAEMMSAETFVEFGCSEMWTIDDGNDYPRLGWEGREGDLIMEASYSGGTGEPNDPFLISTPEDLILLTRSNCHWDKHFKLTSDIDLSNVPPEVLGSIGFGSYHHFTGHFDGDGHNIINLTRIGQGGLFGITGYGALIENLGIVDPNIREAYSTGAIVSYMNSGGQIINCFVQGGIIEGNSYIGGIAGSVYGSSVISGSYVNGTIISGTGALGGLAAKTDDDTVIRDCYANAFLSSDGSVGGLIYSSGSKIEYCYSSSVVISDGEQVGGLTGYGSDEDVLCSYWDVEQSGQFVSAGGEGKTTAEMQTLDTFRGFGCSGSWTIDDGNDYPRLLWEGKPGVLIEKSMYSGGTGEPNDSYLISNADDLIDLSYYACDWDKNFKLIADINLADINQHTITIGKNSLYPFTGSFDGDYHVISNLNFTTSSRYAGLFLYVNDANAVICNLGILNPVIDCNSELSTSYSGSLAGRIVSGKIEACFSRGGMVSGGDYTGGLVGSNGGVVSNSYAITDVNSDGRAGGLTAGSSGLIESCYAAGAVSGDESSVGLTSLGNGIVLSSYWDVDATGQVASGGGFGRTSSQMKDMNSLPGLGCSSLWTIDNGNSRPRLAWEGEPGVLIPRYTYGGGTGTMEDPYQIHNANQLDAVRQIHCDWDKHFRLACDIDMQEVGEWRNVFIGCYSWGEYKTGFSGTFDGAGYSISNLKCIGDSYSSNVGMFSYLNDPCAVIKDLTLKNVNIFSDGEYLSSGAGAITSYLKDGTILRCHVSGTISNVDYSGGLVDYMTGGSVIQCSSNCIISGGDWSGGLVCYNDNGNIEGCFAECRFDTVRSAGGLVMANGGFISDCYAEGLIFAQDDAGGLVCYNDETGQIMNCYAACYLYSDMEVGGLIAMGHNDNVSNCFWDMDISGQSYSVGGEGKTTSEMWSANTYIDADWDFNTPVWEIDDTNDYARLAWEEFEGVFYSGGTGEPNDPYLIDTSEQLEFLSWRPTDWDMHFLLTDDIDLIESGKVIVPIGFNSELPFSGVFDGQGHEINGFTLNATGPYTSRFGEEIIGAGHYGLFGYVSGPGTEIKNVTLSNPSVQCTGPLGDNYYYLSEHSLGALIGRLDEGSVSNCSVINGYVGGDWDNVGGLIGLVYVGGQVIDSYATCSVEGRYNVGGLIGSMDLQLMENCYATGYVTGDTAVGGLAGQVFSYWMPTDNEIRDCAAYGQVTGQYDVGGLVGRGVININRCKAEGDVSGYEAVGGLVGSDETYEYYGIGTGIFNSYANGAVTGELYVGGLCGIFSDLVLNCYSSGLVSGSEYVSGLFNMAEYHIIPSPTCLASYWDVNSSGQSESFRGIGKTTVEMFDTQTFSAWGCEGCWTIDNGNDYPRLIWESSPGQLIVLDETYGGGSGEPDDPYLIYTSEELHNLSFNYCHWDKHFRLMEDIDMNSLSPDDYGIIGSVSSYPFTGVFDGGGHKITDFQRTFSNSDVVGLFGYVDYGTIRNLTLVDFDVNVPDSDYVGALAGRINGSNIENCCVENSRIRGHYRVGGLVGSSNESEHFQCTSLSQVDGREKVGGLVGYSYESEFYQCASLSQINGLDFVGGLIGRFQGGEADSCCSKGIVSGVQYVGGLVGTGHQLNCLNCYSNASVTAVDRVGGFIGYAYRNDIFFSSAFGSTDGNDIVGGFIGYNSTSYPSNYLGCFWDTIKTPDVNGIGNIEDMNVIGASTEQLYDPNTFFDAGWDFNDTWGICDGINYPILLWQLSVADYLCPDGVDFIDYAFLAMHWMETEYGDVNGIELTYDGKVDYYDFAVFANNWMEMNCGLCEGADFTGDGNVNHEDLVLFLLNWLTTDYGDCGGAELNEDGKIDNRDLSIFINEWLKDYEY